MAVRGGSEDRRREALELGQHRGGAEEEVASVPEIAVGDVARSRHGVWLLLEGLELERSRAGDRLSRRDIAIACGRRGRLDAERHDQPAFRRLRRLARRSAEGRGILDHMIGRKNEAERLRVAHRHMPGPHGDGGGGNPAGSAPG